MDCPGVRLRAAPALLNLRPKQQAFEAPECTCFHAALVSGMCMPVGALVTEVAGAPSAGMPLAPGGLKGCPEAASAAPISAASKANQHCIKDR